MEKALKKLRSKFVAIIMGIMALLIVAVFSTICVIDYQQELSGTYDELGKAASAEGIAYRLSDLDGLSSGSGNGGTGNGRHYEFGRRDTNERFIPIAVYAIAPDGSFYQLDTRTPFALSPDILSEAKQRAISAEDGDGSIPALGLLYAKRSYANGSLIAFTDESVVGSWKNLAATLAIVGLATLLVLFIIALIFSKWALRPVEKAWKDQRRFISDASHELKTPLTVISANTAILQKNMDKTIASQSQWVESTEDEVNNMRELVDDLLFIASSDEGKVERAREQVDLTKLVEAQVLQFEALAYENGIELASEIAGGIAIEGDKSRLQRLVRTLLDNACKYAGSGACVDVRLAKESGKTVLSVANSGAAISEEDLPHIFDRFYRADKARVRESGGYGLGLSIARDIAEEHNGIITATSSPEEGTVFKVTW